MEGDTDPLLSVEAGVSSGVRAGKTRTCISFAVPGVVLALIGYGGTVFAYGLVVARFAGVWYAQLGYGVSFFALLTLTVWSYARVMFTDPGSPPVTDAWIHLPSYEGRQVVPADKPHQSDVTPERPVVSEEGGDVAASSVNSSSSSSGSMDISIDVDGPPQLRRKPIRFCKHCRAPKPDRAHHDSYLDRCILRMDHYCPWVNNTVGFFNHKYFFLFCFWCSILCLYAGISIVLTTTFVRGWDLQTWSAADIQLAVVMFYTLIFALTLLSFVGMHLNLLMDNQTTLETFSKEKCWDLGSKLANFQEIFGTRKVTWFLPVAAEGIGTGLEFGRTL